MKRFSLAVALAFASTALTPASAATIDFDEAGLVAFDSTVDDFYNGDGGPDLGVSFQDGDWLVGEDFGETSEPNFATSISNIGFVNFTDGFAGTLGFSYGAFADTAFTIFDGLNGTGAVLFSTTLSTNEDGSLFDPVSFTFSGVARSFAINAGVGGEPAQFAFDDVTFTPFVAAVPEPGTWAMMILGFGMVGGAMRYGRRSTKVSFATA